MNGTFLGIEHMSTQKGGNGGSIINMSSLAGNNFFKHKAPFFCAWTLSKVYIFYVQAIW